MFPSWKDGWPGNSRNIFPLSWRRDPSMTINSTVCWTRTSRKARPLSCNFLPVHPKVTGGISSNPTPNYSRTPWTNGAKVSSLSARSWRSFAKRCALFVEKNNKINGELRFVVTSFQSLHWQGFQPSTRKRRTGAAFGVFHAFPASGTYDGVFRIILVQRGLARHGANIKKTKKILSDSKSGYICCC